MRHRRGASICAVFLSPLRDLAPRVRLTTTAAHTEFWPSERSLLPCQRISGARGGAWARGRADAPRAATTTSRCARVVYADAALAVLDKPAGVTCVPSSRQAAAGRAGASLIERAAAFFHSRASTR